MFRKDFDKKNINKILIYRCGTLGDSIVSFPAINLIRDRFRDADYYLMTANHGDSRLWADTIFAEFDIFKDFITYDDADYRFPWRLIKVIRKVKSVAPDLVIYLASEKNSRYKIFRDRIFFFLTGSRNFYPVFNNYKKNFKSRDKNAREYPKESVRFIAGLCNLGITDLKVQFNLPIRVNHVKVVDDYFQSFGIMKEKRFIALCPWSKMQSKRWPIERYIALCIRLIIEYRLNILIVGGKEEAEVISNYLNTELLQSHVFLFAGKLTVLETAELIRRCEIYIGNDTGPMHIAAAVEVPCVALFSARAYPESWFPYGKGNIVIRKEVDCRNCGLETCIKEKIKCLTEISIEEVYESCSKILCKRLN